LDIKNKINNCLKLDKMHPALKETIDTVVFVLVMVILIRFFLFEIRWIPSGSMKPTLIEKDRIFVERVSRFFSSPERGDVMVFYPPFETLDDSFGGIFRRLTGFFCKDIAYIKRVVGLPGDEIFIDEDENGKFTVFVNGKPLLENYIMSDYDYIKCTEDMFCGPFVVPQGHYFMMGDNRGNSQDSRFWGFLSEDRFIGKAVFLFWPLTRIKPL